jgi:hypothetical protein
MGVGALLSLTCHIILLLLYCVLEKKENNNEIGIPAA